MGDVIIVHDNAGLFHIIVQDDNEDFNVTMCGVEVVVEDPDYYLNYDADRPTTDQFCWQCCEVYGQSGRRDAERKRR